LNLEELIHATRKLRAIFQEDRHRPRYHFVAPEGFCLPFDPNGAIFWRGRYHLFYIVQIEGKGHCWGHASSIDLLHWRIHPTALVPGDGDEGIYSGCALLDKEGVPTIIYLGVNAGICIARSVDENLIHWVKESPERARRNTLSTGFMILTFGWNVKHIMLFSMAWGRPAESTIQLTSLSLRILSTGNIFLLFMNPIPHGQGPKKIVPAPTSSRSGTHACYSVSVTMRELGTTWDGSRTRSSTPNVTCV